MSNLLLSIQKTVDKNTYGQQINISVLSLTVQVAIRSLLQMFGICDMVLVTLDKQLDIYSTFELTVLVVANIFFENLRNEVNRETWLMEPSGCEQIKQKTQQVVNTPGITCSVYVAEIILKCRTRLTFAWRYLSNHQLSKLLTFSCPHRLSTSKLPSFFMIDPEKLVPLVLKNSQ